MPNTVKSHAQARLSICCVCWRKAGPGACLIKSDVELLVKKHVFEQYSANNDAYPASICGSCRICLKEVEKVK